MLLQTQLAEAKSQLEQAYTRREKATTIPAHVLDWNDSKANLGIAKNNYQRLNAADTAIQAYNEIKTATIFSEPANYGWIAVYQLKTIGAGIYGAFSTEQVPALERFFNIKSMMGVEGVISEFDYSRARSEDVLNAVVDQGANAALSTVMEQTRSLRYYHSREAGNGFIDENGQILSLPDQRKKIFAMLKAVNQQESFFVDLGANGLDLPKAISDGEYIARSRPLMDSPDQLESAKGLLALLRNEVALEKIQLIFADAVKGTPLAPIIAGMIMGEEEPRAIERKNYRRRNIPNWDSTRSPNPGNRREPFAPLL